MSAIHVTLQVTVEAVGVPGLGVKISAQGARSFRKSLTMDISGVFMKIFGLLTSGIIPFVLVLGIMIFVHELGHYLTARLIGVRVLMFKLGFGKYIWSFTRGHTEYGIGWIPIGGYVKMFGDPTEVEGGEEDTPLEEIPEEDKAEALYYRPTGQKLLVFVSGPMMNIVMAFLVAPFIYLIGVQQPKEPEGPPVVAAVELESPAAKSGIEPGDRVLAIGGDEIDSQKDLKLAEALNAGETLVYKVERGGKTLDVPVTLRESEAEGTGESGLEFHLLPAGITKVVEDSAAEEAGLEVGDTVTGVNGNALSLNSSISSAVEKSGDGPITLSLLRGGKELEIEVTPRFSEEFDKKMIGIEYSPGMPEMETVRYGLAESVKLGTADTIEYGRLTFVVFYKLISFQLSPKAVTGPVGIGVITSKAASMGISPLLQLVVLISINLGILNLLPFPPLDGGHVVFTVVEKVIGREIKIEIKEFFFKVGFFMLLGLMGLVTLQDIFRFGPSMWNFVKDLGAGLGLG